MRYLDYLTASEREEAVQDCIPAVAEAFARYYNGQTAWKSYLQSCTRSKLLTWIRDKINHKVRMITAGNFADADFYRAKAEALESGKSANAEEVYSLIEDLTDNADERTMAYLLVDGYKIVEIRRMTGWSKTKAHTIKGRLQARMVGLGYR
jgi:DNA-directed RNA polymerase specialized sigma24 family protein